MKTIFLLIALLVSAFMLKVNAQKDSSNWKLSSVYFSTGETPLTVGNTFGFSVTKGSSVLLCDYNDDLGEVLYFYAPSKFVSFGPTGGFFKNTPWFGPVLSFSLFNGHFTTLNWVGWSTGNPEKETTVAELPFCFSFQQATLTLAGFNFKYAVQNYQKNPTEQIVQIDRNFILNKNLNLSGGGGYMIRAEKFLWFMCISYNFK